MSPENSFVIHPATRLGPVSLTVANLAQQLRFYQILLGLQVHWQKDNRAGLGTGGEDLLQMIELPNARRARGTTGLYHFAILVPSRRELALMIARLFTARYPNSPTDHVMTETTYLDDPEGNGIEIYADTPEDGQFGFINGEFMAVDANGVRRSGRDALDVEELFEKNLSASDRLDEPLPAQTKMGHMHLHIRDLNEARHFYHTQLGFGDMGFMAAMRAGFVSAGGYHHHLGLNTWAGEGAPPPAPNSLGLRHFTVVLPDAAELESQLERLRQTEIALEQIEDGWLIRDPSQNGIMFRADERPANP